MTNRPKVLDDRVRFRLDTSAWEGEVTGVSLDVDGAIEGDRELAQVDGAWELRLPRPPLRRMEYRFTVRRDGMPDETVCDPDNPHLVPTAFGERSELRMPGYEQPWWLQAPSVAGTLMPLEVTGETRDALPVTVWSPEGSQPSDPLPLMLVHDGPEYDAYAGITQFSGALIHAGDVPAHRIALAQPVQRDAWYSGSPQYLRTEVEQGLAQLREAYAVTGPVVVAGASLGGLTAVLAGLLGAPDIGGVLSQSGSFFRRKHDDGESGFRFFDRISRTVETVLDTRSAKEPIRLAMTCGSMEENLPNNEDMARALERAGHAVTFTPVPDLHNYTAWRDSLDPALSDLLRACWSTAG